jgi:N-acetylated-alpha-linked acidic dipeptidase
MNDIARDVVDPEKESPVFDRWRANTIANGSADDRREARDRGELRISALGSGSDYTPFLQHLGIPSLDIRFGGEGESDGVYHSIYDSFDHYTRFVDPGFNYAAALAMTAGRAILRFADADYLPLSVSNFGDTVGRYITELTKLSNDERDAIAEKNRRINDKTYELVADPTKTFVTPKIEPPAPNLNLGPLQNALRRLQQSANNYDAAMRTASTSSRLQSRDTQQSLDNALRQIEPTMLVDRGLPRRSWFKHAIYAPGFYTGYGAKTLPGIREAVEQHNWSEAAEQIGIVAATLERTAATDRATAVMPPIMDAWAADAPLSILGSLRPIVEGATAADAFRNCLISRNTPNIGVRRFWLAEHHNSSGIASAQPRSLLHSRAPNHTRRGWMPPITHRS